MNQNHLVSNLFFSLLRYFFSFLLIFTSICKLLDNKGFAEIILSYKLFEFNLFPVLIMALLISTFELSLGISVYCNKRLKLNGILLCVLHLCHFMVSLFSFKNDVKIENYGYFGSFFAMPLTQVTVIVDAIVLALSVAYLLLAIKKLKTKMMFYI